MPLDPSIFAQFLREPKSVADYDAETQQREGNKLALLLQRGQVSDQLRAREEAQRVMQIMQAIPGDATDDERVKRLRSAGLWGQADTIQKSAIERRKGEAGISKDEAAADKDRIANGLRMFEVVGQITSGVKDQASYDLARQQMAQQFPQWADKLPPNYDPERIAIGRKQAQSVTEQLAQEWKAKGYDLDVRKADDENARNAANNATSRANNAASVGVQLRGQDKTDARARDALKLQQDIAAGVVGADPSQVDLMKRFGKPEAGKRWKADGSLEPIPGGAADVTIPSGQKVHDANEAIALINQATPLLEKSTGSYIGNTLDTLGQAFGYAAPGAIAASQLKAIEGALVAKMPKMSGPQSDKDVLLYRQMAAEIGNPNVPAAQKTAALESLREIQERYAGMKPGTSPRNHRNTTVDW